MIRLCPVFEPGHAKTVIRNLIVMRAEKEEARAFDSNRDGEDNLDEDLDDSTGHLLKSMRS